jgi:hypothetical protein
MRNLRRNDKDFWAGLMFLFTGIASLYVARGYRFGKALNMGPGFFPTLLGGLLVLFGIYILIKGLRGSGAIQGNWSIRALVVLPLSLVLFGFLMKHAGFIPALTMLILGSAAAGRELGFREALLCALVLIGVALVVFIWGLSLPYPLIKGF